MQCNDAGGGCRAMPAFLPLCGARRTPRSGGRGPRGKHTPRQVTAATMLACAGPTCACASPRCRRPQPHVQDRRKTNHATYMNVMTSAADEHMGAMLWLHCNTCVDCHTHHPPSLTPHPEMAPEYNVYTATMWHTLRPSCLARCCTPPMSLRFAPRMCTLWLPLHAEL